MGGRRDWESKRYERGGKKEIVEVKREKNRVSGWKKVLVVQERRKTEKEEVREGRESKD